MKKQIYILILLSVLIVCVVGSSIAESVITPSIEIQDFSFHKGLYFGMSREEAVQFEKDTNETDFWGYNKYYDLKGEWGETNLAEKSVDIFEASIEDVG